MAEGQKPVVFDVAAGEGKLLHSRRPGQAFLAVLEREIESVPSGGVLYLDLRGVEMMDYSFADAGFGALISRAARGDYGKRHVVLVENGRDLLEGIEMSLWVREQNVFRVEEVGGEAHLVGKLEEHLVETLEAVRNLGPITTADLAKRLGVNHTACNNRASNLHDRGLISRRKETGGRRYVYERII
ncbi:MAG: MarR family transcriptional regulator [Rubrobacter sp.]